MHCKLYYISFLYTDWSNQRNVPGAEISSNSVPKYFIHKYIAKINLYQEFTPFLTSWNGYFENDDVLVIGVEEIVLK